MTIAYPDNTSLRSPIAASGLTDSTALLDIYSGGERSLTLAELKKTGVQVINVKQYGAVGDGVADDTAAIQAAITACQSGGGGQIYIPTGRYLISSAINIPTGVHIKGTGRESTYIELNGTNFNAFVSNGTEDWSLRDLMIRTRLTSTANGVGLKFTR